MLLELQRDVLECVCVCMCIIFFTVHRYKGLSQKNVLESPDTQHLVFATDVSFSFGGLGVISSLLFTFSSIILI